MRFGAGFSAPMVAYLRFRRKVSETVIDRITAETVIMNVIIASSFLPEGNFPGL